MLQTLSKKELKKFDEYLNSAFFNTNPLLISLYDHVIKDFPLFESNNILRENIFKVLFPKADFDEQRLRYAMTDLVKLLEDFVSYKEYETSSFYQKLQLLSALNKRNLDKYFQGTKGQAKEIQLKHPFRDSNYFYNEYMLEAESNLFFSKQANRTSDESLYMALDSLDIFYLATKLKYCCEVMNRKNVLAVEYDLLFLDEILLYLKKTTKEHQPVVAIYYQILMTLMESDHEDHFAKLKEFLELHIDKFTLLEAKDMYAYVQNYCIKKINKGNTNYLSELFQIYKTLLNKGILMVGEFFSPWDYKNIVVVGMRVEEFEWTENFINEYRLKIAPVFRENAYHYNLAALYFNKQEYSKALKLLQKVDYTDVYYHLDSKSLLLKTYYELNEIEPLLSLIDAFRIFLRRNKLISEYQRTVYSNQVRFVKKVLSIKLKSKNEEALTGLKNEIETTKQVADINWLLKKVEEMSLIINGVGRNN